MSKVKRFCVPGHWTLRQRLDYGTGPKDPKTGCMLWQRCVDKDGYGKLMGPGKVSYRTHMLALSLKLGRPLGSCELARHTCDVPGCVSPAHLKVGTAQNNTDDMMDRNRARGSATKMEQLPTVIRMRKAGKKIREIAIVVGVSEVCVSRWLIDAGMRTRYGARTQAARAKQRSAVVYSRGGLTKAAIARNLNVTLATVSRWLHPQGPK